ncbi:hypothetical protein I546_6899 [Mycobacterium kansasii 732]|nr:hypothetical protein I546_6899 [Mycobacterium kansasii 732]
MLPPELCAVARAPGSRHPDAQHRIVSRRTDTLDAGLDIGITTSAFAARFCRRLG